MFRGSRRGSAACGIHCFKLAVFETMRTIGYILMLLGFIWLFANAFGNSVSPNPILNYFDKRYPDARNYSAVELRQAYRDMVWDYIVYNDRKQLLMFFPPASLMLIGGILLDMALRQSKNQKLPVTLDEKAAG